MVRLSQRLIPNKLIGGPMALICIIGIAQLLQTVTFTIEVAVGERAKLKKRISRQMIIIIIRKIIVTTPITVPRFMQARRTRVPALLPTPRSLQLLLRPESL